MSQGSWGGGGGGWGQGGGHGVPPGGYAPPPGGSGGGWGPPPGGYGQPPPGGGYGAPPGGGAPAMPPGYPPGYAPPGGGASVAWEDTSLSLFNRWWTTVREVTFNSRAFFAAAAYNENPWPAISFAMTTAAIVGLVLGVFLGVLYALIGGLGALSVGALGGSSGGSGAAGSAIFGLMSVLGIGMAIMYPLMFVCGALLAPWIYGGIHHLTLVLLKGTTRSYTHTVRVVGYSYASNVWFLIPGFGAFAGMASMLISLITGLDETHKCGTGNALLAVFLIPGACCVCGCAMQVMFGVAGGMSHGP